MKNIWIIFLFACTTTQPLTKPCPTCPPAVVCPSCPVVTNQVQYVAVNIDSSAQSIQLKPVSGDNYTQLQAAITYAIKNHIVINLSKGRYPYSHILLGIDFTGSDFRQVSFQMIGPASAKASPEENQAILEGPGLIIQRSKGVLIQNICFKGPLHFTGDVQKDLGWPTVNRFKPIAGLVVDPFTDSANIAQKDRYAGLEPLYVPGMNRAGSTGLQVIGCRFIYWEVGICFEPTFQQNGDCSDVIDCCIEYCRTAIAYTQPQNKENHVIRLKSWGNTRTIIDGVTYGKGMGVLPYIDGMNIAGGTYQLFNCSNADFQGSARNIYAELLFKIGTITGYQTTTIENLTADFINYGPVADFIVSGNINFKDAHLRYYDNTQRRLLLTGFCGTFQDGDFDTYPITASVNGGSVYCTILFNHVGLAQENGPPVNRPFLNSPYSNTTQYLGGFNVTVDTISWTGTITGNIPDGYLLTENAATGATQVGRMISGQLKEIGVNIRTGKYNLYLVK